jgi:ketosteroid isomerase-like protein
MEPNMPAMNGKEAIRAGVKEFLADRNFSLNWSPTAVEASKSGDLAYVRGTWTATVTDPKTKKPTNDKGKYASIYRKLGDGSWKVALDINNSDGPPK